MAEHIPTRPFESLDWFRDATRSGIVRRNGRRERFLEWARGIGFLTLHVSVYALSIVTLFVVNLLRSPDRIWIDRTILIWSLILVIHAGFAGLLWAIQLLNREDDEPIRVVSDAHWRHAETWPTGAATTAPEPPPATVDSPAPVLQNGHLDEQPVAKPTTSVEQPGATTPQAPSQSTWSGWESDIPQAIDPHDPDRASWQEAAPAAWRARRKPTTRPANDDSGDLSKSGKVSRPDGGV